MLDKRHTYIEKKTSHSINREQAHDENFLPRDRENLGGLWGNFFRSLRCVTHLAQRFYNRTI